MTKEQFLEGMTDWSNHRALLYLALEATKGDVIEFGCGDGSTRQLHEYCKANNRKLYSYETDLEWLLRFKDLQSDTHFLNLVDNWEEVSLINPSVILIDHSPGERRYKDVIKFANINGILVLHDTQPPPTAADYKYEKTWHLFKHIVTLDAGKNEDPNIEDNRTWATAVSNTFDVTQWAGQTFNNGSYILK